MDKRAIKRIFVQNHLGKAEKIRRIEIGWTNKVYSVNDKFILKVCEDTTNEKHFEKEVFFYNLFEGKIPVPKITVYDKSKKVYPKHYIIYSKIQGDNLYAKWHLFSNPERKRIIKQLCNILRIINKAPCKRINWHDKIITKLKNSLMKVEKKRLLPTPLIQTIKEVVKVNHHLLKQQKIALVYWDAHFDNLIIKDKKLVGIIDFERTESASIDFQLDIIKRMVEYPKKYMSKEFEKFGRKEDYTKLLIWFKEFYPELFNFKELDKRLDLYALEHELSDLLGWPKSKAVKEMIVNTLNYNPIKKEVEPFAKKYCSTYHEDQKLWENHVQLVRKYALRLAEIEKCDKFVVEIASLLHDIGKYKGRSGHTERSYELSKKFLKKINILQNQKELILECIRKHDSKHSQQKDKIEVKVVQCADALGTLFDDEWQEHSRRTVDKEILLGLFDKTYHKISLVSARKIAKPQVEKLRKIVRSMR